MKLTHAVRLFLTTALFAMICSTAQAGETNAYCDVRKHGDKAKGATGNCSVHDNGNIVTMTWANDESYTLTKKKDKKNAFKDQKGNGVHRKIKDDGTHKYEWEHKNVTVTFHGVEKKKK